MAPITILSVAASKFVALLIGTSPELDRTCKALGIGRRRCLITAALGNLASTVAPPGALTTQDVRSLGASVLFLSVWVTFQRPIRSLLDMLQPRRILNPMGTMDAIDFQFDKLRNTRNNSEFFDPMNT